MTRASRAAPEDFDAIAELWRALDHELPPPTHEPPEDVEEELAEVREIIASEIAFVAEEDDATRRIRPRARRRADGFGTLTDLYVARRCAPRRRRDRAHAGGAAARSARSGSSTSTSRCSRPTTSRARCTRAGG